MAKAFTRRYEDHSTEAGFSFTFYCDMCNDGYDSGFIAATGNGKKRYKKSTEAEQQAPYGLSELLGEMDAWWHKEHEKAFLVAQEEAKCFFHHCEKCHKWVCPLDFDEEKNMCIGCRPGKRK